MGQGKEKEGKGMETRIGALKGKKKIHPREGPWVDISPHHMKKNKDQSSDDHKALSSQMQDPVTLLCNF